MNGIYSPRWNVAANVYQNNYGNSNQQNNNRPTLNSFQMERRCHDNSGSFFKSKTDAEASMRDVFGGYFNGQYCLVADGNRKQKEAHVYRFKCRVSGCGLRIQLRSYENGTKWFVFSRNEMSVHSNHIINSVPQLAKDIHGLHPLIRRILQDYVQAGNRSILRISANELLRHVASTIKTDSVFDSIRYCVSDQAFMEKLKLQLKGYVSMGRESFITEQLQGVSRIMNYNALVRILCNWELNVPANYVPSNEYQNAEQLACALGVKTTHQMFIYDISSGTIFDAFKEKLPTQSLQSEFTTKMEYSFFIFSPNSLFQLMTYAKRRPGTRAINGDGTWGICRDGSVLVIFGATSVKLRTEFDRVSSSLRPFCYLKAGGERKYSNLVTLYALRQLCWRLFRLEFELDWGISDHADAFVSAFIAFRSYPDLVDMSYRSPIDFDVMTRTEASSFVGDYPQNSIPFVSQLSQESCQVNTGQRRKMVWLGQCGLFCLQVRSRTTKTCNCAVKPTSLQCAFHALQPFAKRDSYVGKLKDKSLFNNQKQGKRVVTTGPAYEQCLAIKSTRTELQRSKVTELVLQHWQDINESEAAQHLLEQYCSFPYNYWNIAASGEAGIYPIGNSSEVHNRIIKSKGVNLVPNGSIASFLVWNGPRLLEDDAMLRFDPCTIIVPRRCSSLMVAVSGFLRPMVDYRDIQFQGSTTAGGVLFNRGCMIGVPLTDKRIVDVFASYNGNAAPFTATDKRETKWDVARRMIRETNFVCYVKRNQDGIWVGNCDDCFKYLGYDCEGCTIMRDQHNYFSTSLNNLRKTCSNGKGEPNKKSSGNVNGKYWSGLTSKRKEQQPALTTFSAYLQSLSKDQMSRLVQYLCLVPDGMTSAKSMKQKELLDTLLDFAMDTTAFREKQKQQRKSKKRKVDIDQGDSKKTADSQNSL